ncbi:MAG: energy-coupling factor ABC transporter permease [Candidatus Longimicrobiales bacterium M2_2A_002]
MAHIPDGLLTPPVIAGAAALSATALAVAARRSRDQLKDRQAPLLGAATAFVFAAQMFNFPLGAGTSAHLLGGVLVAVVVGPWAAMLALFSVLLVQALLFQDGGIAALGANTLNLAVLGAGGGYLVYRWQLALIGSGERRRLVAAGVAAFVSSVAIGLAVGLELGLSGLVPTDTALLAVGGAHVLVGLAEAALTVGILAMVLRARPDLVESPDVTPRVRLTAGVVGVSAVVALAAGAWASALPDALEASLEAVGVHGGRPLLPAPMSGYDVAGSPWVAGAVGVVLVFVVGWLVFRLAARSARTT